MKKYIFTLLFFSFSFLCSVMSQPIIDFNEGESEPNKEGLRMLDDLLFTLHEYPLTDYVLNGYSDSTEVENIEGALKLSGKRVLYCKNFLIENGIDSCRIQTFFYGNQKRIVFKELNNFKDTSYQDTNSKVEFIPIMREHKVYGQFVTSSLDSLTDFTKKYKANYPNKNIVVCPYGNETKDISLYLEEQHLDLSYISLRRLDKGGFTLPDVKTPKEIHENASHLLIGEVYFENSENFIVFVLEWMCGE